MKKFYEKPLLTEDYLIRMINLMLAALARLVGLKTAGQFQSAAQVLDQALEQMFGLRVDLIRRLDDQVLLANLTVNGQLDTDRVYLVAELFAEEGELYTSLNLPVEAYWSRLRALNFFLEVSRYGGAVNFPTPHERIGALVRALARYTLPLDTLSLLFAYDIQMEAYGEADQVFRKMVAQSGADPGVLEEGLEFYQHLLDFPEEDLQETGLERSQVETRLAALQAMV